jgi:hypothetical protein
LVSLRWKPAGCDPVSGDRKSTSNQSRMSSTGVVHFAPVKFEDIPGFSTGLR